MKLLLIGRKTHYETRRIVAAAKKRGHETLASSFANLEIKTGDAPRFAVEGRDALDFDVLMFRRFWPHVSESLILAETFRRNGGRVFDGVGDGRPFIMSKTWEALTLEAAGLRVPKTIQCFSAETSEAAAKELGFPLVVKGVHGGLGTFVHLAKKPSDLRKILSGRNFGFFSLQEYLPADHDVRVLTIGGQAIGAMRRIVPKGDFRANVAVGGRPVKEPLSAELERLAEAASRALGREFGGVDILRSKGETYVLEVNRTPGFRAFEAATGVDVADRLVARLERRDG